MSIVDISIYIATIVAAYLIGSIPCGYLIGKKNNIDIRQHGSGNIGATNVRRVLGMKWGRVCFACDFLKGLIPVLICVILLKKAVLPETAFIAPMLAAFATTAGHIWPVFLSFKGGKGVSTIAGAIIPLAPFSIISGAIVWVGMFYLTRYVSVASIAAALTLPFSAIFFNMTGSVSTEKPTVVLLLILALIAIIKHIDNIKRLLNGTENRFKPSSSEEKAE